MESEDLLSRISEVHPNQVWLDKGASIILCK